jgi:hypothetical protein
MKVYVAGSSKDAAEVSRYMRSLEAEGHVITHDWTAGILAGESPNDGLSEERARELANECWFGVVTAEELHLFTGSRTIGAWVELGMAIARCIPVRVIGEPEEPSIFFALCEREENEHR